MGLFGKGVSRICAVVAAPTAAETARQIRAALHETSTIELRLDWLRSDPERARLLRWLKRQSRRATFIATCRRRVSGGQFPGSVQAELEWLVKAREAGCSWCDVEIETLRQFPDKSIRGFAIPARVMLSVHDFRRTPPLARLIGQQFGCRFAALKIAAHSRTLADSLRLLRIARVSHNRVPVPMGETGLPARILALQAGSALAYAPVEAATAPGQVSLQETKYLYRAHELNRATQVFGVIGDPVAHSLSPLLHNTGFASQRMNAVYLPFLVKNLRDFLRAAPEFGLRGFSITLPHKQAILKYLDECDPLAAAIGAVNTVVVRPDGSLSGANTDYIGVLRSLEKQLRLAGSRILVFGAGGAARAAAFALARAGAAVFICARRQEAARGLARAAGGEVLSPRALRTSSFDAILNATPVGMHPREAISPLAPEELHCRIVMDLIYRPERTQLLRIAARKGISTISGVEMFLTQAFAQWEIWLRRRAPEAPMRRAVLATLRADARRQAAAPSSSSKTKRRRPR